jgi:hypothetical protein
MTDDRRPSGGDDPATHEAGRLFANALAPLPPSAARLERLRARLIATSSATKAGRRRSARVATVALALGLAGAAVAARPWPFHSLPVPAPTRPADSVRADHPTPPELPNVVSRAPAALEPDLPKPLATRAPGRPNPGPRAPLPASAHDPTPHGLAAETRLLTAALADIDGHDGARALGHLDEYRRRFPTGVLRLEADRTRVEALLVLGRRGDALATLETDASSAALSPAQRLLRAELRADVDCARALHDFDALLAGATALPPALHERALRGRALCHAQRGDRSAARADFAAYLAAHPAGRFADEARAHLAGGTRNLTR